MKTRAFLVMLLYLFLACSAGFSQERLSVDDVAFLLGMGISEEEVISHINQAGVSFSLTEEQARQLKEKGASLRVLMALGYVPSLTADDIIALMKSGKSEEEMLSLVQKAEKIPPFGLEDWLKIRRASVPASVIKAIKARLDQVEAKRKVTFDEIVQWVQAGTTEEDILKKIEERGVQETALTADILLKLKRSKVPLRVIYALKKKIETEGETKQEEKKAEEKKEVATDPAEARPSPTFEWKTFVHLGLAFSIPYRSDWYYRSKLDDNGYPQYYFGPGPEENWEESSQGLMVSAFPLEDEALVKDEQMMEMVIQYIKEEEPGVEISKQIRTTLDKKTAIGVAFQGKMRKQKEMALGVLITAVHQEAIFMIHYWSKENQWQEYLPSYEYMIKHFMAPARAELIRPDTAPRTNAKERVRDVADKLRHSVVLVYIPERDKLGEIKGIMGYGSGFVVREDGYAITNRHVVDPGMMGVKKPIVPEVMLGWDKTLGYPEVMASVVAVSEKHDLALLKIKKPGKYQPILLSDIEDVRSGDEIIVLGFPNPSRLGVYDMNVNQGTLTAVEHDEKGRISRIRHSAKTTGGNSGGPLYDLDLGGVVGVHTWGLYEESRMNKGGAEQLYWAGVPVNQIYREFPQITTRHLAENVPTKDRLTLGAWYFGQKRYGAAMLEFQEILKEDTHNADALAYLGRIYHEQTKPEEAMKNYRRALTYNSKSPIALTFMAKACFDQREYKEAISYARRALQEKPNSSTGKVLLAASLIATNQIEEAREVLKQMEEKGPVSWEVHYLLGVIYMQQGIAENRIYKAGNRWCIEEGAKEKILYHLNQSVKIRPQKNGGSYQYLAQVAMFENDLETAGKYIDKGLETDPKNVDLHLFACSLFFQHDKMELALAYVKKAIGIQETPNGFYWIGAILFKLQKYSESLGAFRKSLELNPRYGLAHEALYFMGMIYYSQRNYTESVNCFRRSLQIKPDFSQARQALYNMGYKE